MVSTVAVQRAPLRSFSREEPREQSPFRSEQKAAQSRAHESKSAWLGYQARHARDGIAAKDY